MEKQKEFSASDIENVIEDQFSSPENELKVISYLLRKNYKLYHEINESYFTNENFRFFYALLKKYNSSFPEDMLTKIIKTECKKEDHKKYKVYIEKIFEEPLTGINKNSINVLMQDLKKMSESRFMMGALQKIMNMIGTWDIKKAKKILRPIFSIDRTEMNTTGELLEDFEEVYQTVKEWGESKGRILIKTGIDRIDRLIGGIQRGEWGLIAGETGIGKSIFLANIALNACYKFHKNVVFVTLEMPKIQVELRCYSWLAKVLYSKFRLGNLSEKDLKNWRDTIEAKRKKHKTYFEIISKPRGTNCIDIENELYEIQERRGAKVDLVIIDYLNIMDSNKKYMGTGKEANTQAEIAWDLKKFAAGFNNSEGIPIWSACQIKDEAYGQEVISSKHIKYSRGISEHCPLIFGMTITDDDELVSTMTCSTVKIRDAVKVNPFQLFPNYDFMTIEDIEVDRSL